MHVAFRPKSRFFTSKTLKASGYRPRKSRNCAVSIHCYGNIALNNNSAGLSGTKSRDSLRNWKEPNTPMRNWWAESIITWQTLSDAASANEAETSPPAPPVTLGNMREPGVIRRALACVRKRRPQVSNIGQLHSDCAPSIKSPRERTEVPTIGRGCDMTARHLLEQKGPNVWTI